LHKIAQYFLSYLLKLGQTKTPLFTEGLALFIILFYFISSPRRSKAKTISSKISFISELFIWGFNSSSLFSTSSKGFIYLIFYYFIKDIVANLFFFICQFCAI